MSNCSICSEKMSTREVTTARKATVQVNFCRQCDRRKCGKCGHYEQNVFAHRCTSCGGIY